MANSRTGLFTTLALSTLAAPAVSQELTGMQGTLSFSERITASDNPDLAAVSPGTVVSSVTTLSFGLLSETTVQTFRFGIGTDYSGNISGGDAGFEMGDINANLSYNREGANSAIGLSAKQTYSDVENDPGTLSVLSGSINYQFGTQSPLSFSIGANREERSYRDTVDAGLIDQDTTSVNASARAELNSSSAITARTGRTVTEDATLQVTDEYIGLGYATENSSGLKLSGDLLYDETEIIDLGLSINKGIGVELNAEQARPDGTITASLTSRIDASGRRSTATIGRNMELPRGDLSYSLGVVEQEGDSDLRFVAGLSYRQETPDGAFSLGLSQTPGTSGTTPQISTDFNLNYSADINSVSAWSVGLGYTATDDLLTGDSSNRTTAGVSYRRDLAEDWGLNTGLEMTLIEETGAADRSRNTLFFSIERDLTFGF